MSGHSKWSTIKEITVAASTGGMDVEANPRLRAAVQNAKGLNMPKDTIQRAINKADKDNSSFMELTFEGMLPNGIGVFIDCLTDNRNRTVGNVRSIFTKRGGNLGTNGSLGFMFDRKGVISLPKGDLDPDEFELEVIDAGVEEIELEDDVFMITTPMEEFHNVQMKLEEMGLESTSAELQRIPTDTIELPLDQAVSIMKIVDEFEDDDDVQAVSHNLELTDEVSERLD